MPKTASLFALLLSALLLPAPLLAGETTRTLKAELSPADVSHFRVENLAGSMKVIPATDGKVTAIATIHAESDKIAGLMRFERISGENGIPTLRVIYPLDKYDTIRFSPGHAEEGFLGFLTGSSTNTKYAGHRVKVSGSDGVLLYADVEVRVPPAKGLDATFRNVVGALRAEEVQGKLRFDSGSGEILLNRLKGEVQAETGSGDVKAADLSGSFSCDTGSGDSVLTGFQGEKLSFNAGSGDIIVKSGKAREITADTGSGDILVTGSEVERFDADTGSGDVVLESRGDRLTTVKTDTGSGDVTLRLAPGATFEARADQGSGDIRTTFKDAEAIIEDRHVVGYRRGDTRIRIDVSTGSGDLLIEPLP
jgi:hypothetical protein